MKYLIVIMLTGFLNVKEVFMLIRSTADYYGVPCVLY